MTDTDIRAELRRLIERHGAQAVRAVLADLVPAQPGRPPEDDTQALVRMAGLVSQGASVHRAATIVAQDAPRQHSLDAAVSRLSRKYKADPERWLLAYLLS